MAVRLSDIDLSVTEIDDVAATRKPSMTDQVATSHKGEGARNQLLHTDTSTGSLFYNASQGNLIRIMSQTASLPSVSDIAGPLPSDGVIVQHHIRTSSMLSDIQPQPRVIRRSKLSELMTDIRKNPELDENVNKYLAEADELILQKKTADAIPCLEAALLSTADAPKIQCLLWRILGNTHLCLGHYKKASVCHMHQIAFCREFDDFAGMTMAECNLGIAYMKLGLLKLSGRCFVQYLDNSRVLMDEMGVAYACSNLGVLTKQIAIEEYKKIEGTDRNSKLEKSKKGMDALKDNVQKAISYFEQHLEIVEKQSDIEKQGRVYSHLGSCHEMLHQYNQAIFCHKRRLDIVRSTGDHNAEICTLCNLGNCLRAIGKLQDALDNYSLGLELCQATDDKSGESKILLNLGTTCQLLGQNQKAIEWYTLYYCMCVEGNDVIGQTRASGILAELYHSFGQEFQAYEYFKKLADNLKSIGDKEGANTANGYVIKSKQAMMKQKQKYKTKLNKKMRPFNKKGMDKYLKASVEGSLDQLHKQDDPIVIGGRKMNKPLIPGTWSPGINRWYNTRLTGNVGTWSHAATATGLPTKHRQIYQDASNLSTLDSNLYRTKGVINKLDAQEDLEEVMKSVRTSFYTLGNFMEPIHHRVTSDEGSITEYEDIEEEGHINSVLTMPSAFGSSRHIKDLKHISKSILAKEERIEMEWAEWLDLHNVLEPNNETTTVQKENAAPPSIISPLLVPVTTGGKKIQSTTQLRQKKAPPVAPPPPPLPLKSSSKHNARGKKGIRSFRGLSIFNNNNNSISQEDLLQNSNSDSSNSKLSNQGTKRNTPLDTSLVVGNYGIDDVDTGYQYHGTNTGYRSIANVPTTFRESQII